MQSAAPGKRVGSCLYLHRNAMGCLTGADADKVARAAARLHHDDWNVVKICKGGVSFLSYEDFDTAPFPALLTSSKVDLPTGEVTTTDYRSRDNPPILHRKELLLAPVDPRIPRFSALTRQAEEHGLFDNVRAIGTRQRWFDLLREKGLILRGDQIGEAHEPCVEVERHRTAIARRDLSQPMALMRRFGMIAPGMTVFDYGCGQGDDVAALCDNGVEAFGWDPHHAPDGPRRPGDVVNLGFVINVIEDPYERIETVKAAWGFARRAMVVSAMPASKASVAGLTPYRDGFLTKRGTFQRYFAQDDIRDLVHRATGKRSLSLAPGIIAIFRDEDLEQEVIFRRRSRAEQIADRFVRRERPVAVKIHAASQSLLVRIGEQIEAIRKGAIEIGRLPDASELPQSLVDALGAARVSFDRAIMLACESGFREALREAAEARREDLLLHFAMTLFPGAPKFTTLPRSLQRDVKTFFGSHAVAMADATNVLFSAGDPAALQAAVVRAVGDGLGGVIGGAFCFRSAVLDRLPVVLRVLVGCAEVVSPDLSDCDFMQIVPADKRIRAFRCDNQTKPLPRLTETAEVDLTKRRSKRSKPVDAVLYLKGCYMRADEAQKRSQVAIDERLRRAGILDADGVGPTGGELAKILRFARGGPKP